MLGSFVFRNLFDEVFDSSFNTHGAGAMMCTDIIEKEDGHEVLIDIPGVKKENVTVELNQGYLIVSAVVGHENTDNEKPKEKYIRRERFVGTYRRSFYVGENIKQEDIKAKIEEGVLHLFVPDVKATPQIEQKNYIAIEG